MFRALCLVLLFVAVRSIREPEKREGTAKLGHSIILQEVKCYSCIDCMKISYNTTVKECPYTDLSKKPKCVTYIEKYQYLDKPWYIRGCVSERGDCDEIRKAHENVDMVTLSSCNECEGDRCNGSHSHTMAFLTLVVGPILAKLALS